MTTLCHRVSGKKSDDRHPDDDNNQDNRRNEEIFSQSFLHGAV